LVPEEFAVILELLGVAIDAGFAYSFVLSFVASKYSLRRHVQRERRRGEGAHVGMLNEKRRSFFQNK